MKAIIVEDSRLARVELKELLKAHPEILLCGEAENAEEAIALLEKESIDLIFLDIHLPGKNGFEFLEMLDAVPAVIFTTAYDEYAIKSFDYNALDYVLKPILPERLEKAVEKALTSFQETTENQEALDGHHQIFIKEGEHCWLVKVSDIMLLEANGNYTRVYFEDQKPMIYKSLHQIELRLNPKHFFRANRQQMIQLSYVKEVQAMFKGNLKVILQNDQEVALSRRQSGEFKKRLSL